MNICLHCGHSYVVEHFCPMGAVQTRPVANPVYYDLDRMKKVLSGPITTMPGGLTREEKLAWLSGDLH